MHQPPGATRSPAGGAGPAGPGVTARTGHRPTTTANRAEALHWWRTGYEAGRQAAEHDQRAPARWDRLVASFHTQHAADQQAKLGALLLEAIAALAGLFNGPDHTGNRPA